MRPIAKTFLLVLLVSLSSLGFCQGDPPTAELVLPKAGKAGSKIRGVVRLTFAPGLHGYQNPPTKDFMIPVTVETKTKGFVLKPSYPAGVIKQFAGEDTAVYEGMIEIPIAVTLPKLAGTKKLQIEIGYQQCDEQACFRPDSLILTATIKVSRAAKP